MLRTPFCLLMLLISTAVMAADDKTAPPPPLPEDSNDSAAEAASEPEVTIIQRKDRMIEEYRVNGQLRYVKITPKHGVPYYIVDTDGDGVLDQQFNSLDNPPISQWILLEW